MILSKDFNSYDIVIPSEIFPGFYNTDLDPSELFDEDYEEGDFSEYVNRICKKSVEIIKDNFPQNFIKSLKDICLQLNMIIFHIRKLKI